MTINFFKGLGFVILDGFYALLVKILFAVAAIQRFFFFNFSLTDSTGLAFITDPLIFKEIVGLLFLVNALSVVNVMTDKTRGKRQL